MGSKEAQTKKGNGLLSKRVVPCYDVMLAMAQHSCHALFGSRTQDPIAHSCDCPTNLAFTCIQCLNVVILMRHLCLSTSI